MVQFLVFKIKDQEFAVDVLSVQEIVSYTYLTPVPGSPEYMQGLINLRGSILHVISLSHRVGITKNAEEDGEGIIIVVSFESRKFGIMVDMVADVVNVHRDSVTENPMLEDDCDFVQASHIVKIDDRIIVVLSVADIIHK